MLSDEIGRLLRDALAQAQAQGVLPAVSIDEPDIERPQDPAHGDYATGLPLKMARAARMSPMEIARSLARFIPPRPEFEQIEVAPPGFINFTLSPAWLQSQVETVLREGTAFGDVALGGGQRVQVEFVSVNPTGPIHVGHGRVAVIGSALANVLEAAGYAVQREYYVNDGGNQMDAFHTSLWARYLQALGRPAEMPESGYVGEYVRDLAREIIQEEGEAYAALPPQEGARAVGRRGMEKSLAAIRRDLDRLRVTFDEWFSEVSLYRDGTYDTTMELLRAQGYMAEKEGAHWFISSALGEEKDNVLVRSTGVPTYFAADAAYHYNKFALRGFQRVIDIWGADHQGHVPRMKAVVRALGVDPERLQVITVQLVALKRGGEALRLSKRRGELVTLAELLDDVGPDACRYFFLARSADAQMEFDLDLATKEAPENPVYYIQYAHARIASIQRMAQERSMAPQEADLSLLSTPIELSLIRKLLQLPEVVEAAARTLAPHRLPHYALELATLFHDFYTQCRVVGEDPALTAARLKLVEAVRLVLAKALALMGMSVPERM